MSIKKNLKNKQRSDHFLEDKIKWSMILPRFFGVGVIGMEIQKKQTKEKEEDLTKK